MYNLLLPIIAIIISLLIIFVNFISKFPIYTKRKLNILFGFGFLLIIFSTYFI